MIIQNLSNNKVDTYDNISISTKQNVKFEASENKKTKREHFEDICKKYPNVSFFVASPPDGYPQNNYPYSGISDTRNFGDPGVKSITVTAEVLEKMDVPEYEKKVFECLDKYTNDAEYKRNTSGLNETYKFIFIEDSHGKKGMTEVFAGACGSTSPCDYMKSFSGKNSNKDSIVSHEMILRKISFLSEERYNKLVSDLFHDEDKDK